ncbi:hypothetical protein [Clostridium tertium]|uniref:hypothetical protein n=1 Tax=Clostridium tertium TaxID=1559 RepID=UPI0035635954
MEEKEKIVQLIEIEEFQKDMKKIEEYCKFIEKTLRTISKMERLNSLDIEKSIEQIDMIKSYVSAKAKGDELKAKMSFIFGDY